jgi:hypothetical protein
MMVSITPCVFSTIVNFGVSEARCDMPKPQERMLAM